MDSQADLDVRRNRVLFDFLARRGAGEAVSIEYLEKAHPDLMPELRGMLEGGLKKLRQAIAADQPTQSLVRGYSFRREISGGGQGTVYEAVQESTGQIVAVKVFRPTNRNAVARFEREVAALAGLNHPGIVRIFDCGRTNDGNYFLAMEYVAGSDLDEWIERHRNSLDAQQELIDCFVQIADAVGSAHAAGIIHRDLKPSNIRVDSSGRPKVIDFGLASLTNDLSARELTLTGNVVGSIRWASPEQAAGSSKAVTAASDVYSLGVLLYEAVSSQPPYVVDGPLHTVTQSICVSAPKRLDRLQINGKIEVTKSLAEVVQTCLAKKPEARYESAADLSVALRCATLDVPRYRSRRTRRVLLFVAMACAVMVFVATKFASPPPQKAATIDSRVDLSLLTNSIGMRFRQIPNRSFRLGSPPNEVGRNADEVEHTAAVPHGFWMAETEVTREQYRQIMRPSSATLPDAEASLPVSDVSWVDAVQFCDVISKRENRQYRLPSEDEWEICCRAASRTPFAVLRPESSIWMNSNSKNLAHRVGSLQANDWGLFDMSGNVSEWTTPQFDHSLNNRRDRAPIHDFRVIRGGTFDSDLIACRSSARSASDQNASSPHFGFRPALIIP